MEDDDKKSVDLERDGNGGPGKRSLVDSCPSDTDSCPSDTDSCPSDTDSCPSDSTENEDDGDLPELKTFEPKPQPIQRRKSSIQKMIELVLEKEDEVRVKSRDKMCHVARRHSRDREIVFVTMSGQG